MAWSRAFLRRRAGAPPSPPPPLPLSPIAAARPLAGSTLIISFSALNLDLFGSALQQRTKFSLVYSLTASLLLCFLFLLVSFGASYQKKKRIQSMRVRCAADDEGEISPLLPSSCRYVPTCSEYSMQAYRRYGVVKGTILTAWRLCRCNPLGGYGYDPPRWFGEEELPDQ